MHVCVYVRMWMCVYVCIYVHMWMCVYVCIYVFLNVLELKNTIFIYETFEKLWVIGIRCTGNGGWKSTIECPIKRRVDQQSRAAGG